MRKCNKLLGFTALLFSNFLYANDTLSDNSLEEILNEKIELKSQIGSRDNAKNYLDSSSPIDVITSQQISSSGQTKLTDLLKYFVPGFNTIETSIADASDHIRSFTLRGMSSDQVLVLVNGKRLHTSAIFNEGTGLISSGTTHVDLNTVPLISIERIEILRDGAAAQYGSDAISGIINIVLKGQNTNNEVSVHTGVRKEGDGSNYQLDSFISIPLDYDGFTNISLSANKQYQTQRAGADRRVEPAEVHTHVGIPDSQSLALVLNSEIVQENDIVLYTRAILNYRDTQSSAFYRIPDSSRVQLSEGFLPIMDSEVLDSSVTFGAKGIFANSWNWDLSNVYGYNQFDYNSKDTMNFDLDSSSQTSFNIGKLIFTQNTTNFDIKKKIDNFTFAAGVEYRYENYQIQAGDAESYFGTGSQGYTGYTPQNEVDKSRNNYALYLDTTYKNTKNLNAQLALRFESYSDFGATQDVKLALGYKIIPKLLLRTTASTGFRAPSLAQENFSHTSSALSNDLLLQKGIFTTTHPVAQSLGSQELKPELSKHLTLGAVYQFTNKASLMIDLYYVKVDDKILISDKQSASSDSQEQIFAEYGVSSAAYLTNAIDTKTRGVDIKLNNNYTFENSDILETTLWYSHNKNEITNFNDIFSNDRVVSIEKLQPRSNIKFSNNYKKGKFNYLLNVNSYSEIYQSLGGVTYKFGSMTTVDINVNYKVNKMFELSIGGNNILDEMPDFWDRSNKYLGYDGILPYTNNTPIGASGAYYYLNAGVKF